MKFQYIQCRKNCFTKNGIGGNKFGISEQKKWDFKFVRVTTDLICTGLGFLFGIVPGVGTIITAFFMGPLIEFFNKKVAEPMRYGRR